MNIDQSVGFCAISEVGPPLSQKNAAAENIFSNTMVWRIIGSYLNVGDMKACRLVNSGFHAMVTKETNFLQRCVVSLKPEQITRNNFGSTTELWKNVLLKFQRPGGRAYSNFSDQDMQNLDWLFPMIANVQSLSLRLKKGTKVVSLSPLFKRLLLAPEKLRSLAIEPIFLVRGTEGTFEGFKEVLGNLEELEILEPSPKWLLDVDEWEDIDPWLVSSSFINQLKHLRVLKSYYIYLRKFDFTLPVPVRSPATFTEGEILTSVLTRIAHQSCKTLEHVTLGESRILYQKPSFPPLPFSPDMYTQPGTVTKFFETMPMLQELDLSVRLSQIPIEVLNWMEQRRALLRKVKLESWDFRGNKWNFLEQTKLEEFQLGVLNSAYYTNALPNEALIYLPSTIRRLFLRGPLEANPAPALTRLNPTLITQITFINNGNYLGNDAIAYIRKNFVMLRKLNVTNASMVTDAAFIRSSSGESSMSGMKGLRTLILRKCGSITDATLREIRFFELSYLDLAYNNKLTEDGFERILSNNPSLETLLTSCKDVYRKREHLCASHPRLSSVMYHGLRGKKQAR